MKIYLLNFLSIFLSVYWFLFLVHFVISWIPAGLGSFRKFIYSLTEPILVPIRKIVPPMGGLDFSIIIAILLINILQNVIARYL